MSSGFDPHHNPYVTPLSCQDCYPTLPTHDPQGACFHGSTNKPVAAARTIKFIYSALRSALCRIQFSGVGQYGRLNSLTALCQSTRAPPTGCSKKSHNASKQQSDEDKRRSVTMCIRRLFFFFFQYSTDNVTFYSLNTITTIFIVHCRILIFILQLVFNRQPKT